MADADAVTLAKINYYCREKYFRHMQTAAADALKNYGRDPVLKLFYGYSLILEDRVQEGMRELESIKDVRDVMLAAILLLIYAHKMCKTIDREAIQDLDAKLKEARKSAGEKALYYAGLFLFHCGRLEKAKEYTDRMLKLAPQSKEGLILKGWIELMTSQDGQNKKSVKYFDEAMCIDGNKDADALFGKAKYFELKNHFSGALELLNQAVVAFPNFLPALLEKMKIQLALQDWEQMVEVAQRAVNVEHQCVEAQRYMILNILCREGNYPLAASRIGDLIQDLDRLEPKNPYLYYDTAQLFSRVSGRHPLVLQQTFALAERAMNLDDSSTAEFMTELGYELILQNRIMDAMRYYRSAMKLDESSVTALMGIISCQLSEGMLDDAEMQLEFLNELQSSIGKSSELMYLTSVLDQKKKKPSDEVLQLLGETVDTHFAQLTGLPLGPQYFVLLNPDFLVSVIKDFLNYAPTQPCTPGQPVSPVLQRCLQVLEPITRSVPGLLQGLFLMGKVKFYAGEIDSAQVHLKRCLELDGSFSDAHILMAQIHLYQGKYKQASQSLEVGLSYNFEVREYPHYHQIQAQLQKKTGELKEAVKTLQYAMSLPGVKTVSSKRGGKIPDISSNDRVSIFLELAEAHCLIGEQHEAAKVMQDAINEFHGTPEEVRIIISNADLSLNRGDVELALSMLRNITPEQTYYVQAREKMADIYLHHRKDKRLFASCYRELVEKYPSPHTSLLLGDAYISIQEPERAIAVYEQALKRNPRDSVLATKIGQALVKTHNYGKAINYYEAALKTGNQNFLRYDLAELLLKLRQFDKAEKVVKQGLDHENPVSDLAAMMNDVRFLVLLAKVYEKAGRAEQGLSSLNKAKELQARVLKRVPMEQADTYPAHKQLAANICSQMAQYAASHREFDKAIKLYREALMHNDSDSSIMLALAKLYMGTEDLDACQHQCNQVLRNDRENDAATVMLADVLFRKNEYEASTHHFQQLLERKPCHSEALVKLIEVMRRIGKLEEIPHFLEQAEQSNPRAAMDPGLNYCKGLYEWYSGNPNAALKSFNKVRKDNELGLSATYNMMEICLNPDNEIIGGETFENADNTTMSQSNDKQDSQEMALKTAERLFKEIRTTPGDVRYKILENSMLMSTKTKPNVERALSAFMDISSSEREHAGALWGMATAYMILKQVPRARNQLKRVAKNSWNFEDAEYLERCWLLLADIYIQSGKFDMATDLLKRCLQHNKSCCKAYEYMGYIMEKEQAFKDAAKNYEWAWKYVNKSNPNIGYKLAFNYLKAKRYIDAIDICHHVLANHPNYPKIRKDIMEKARCSLRV